MTDADWNNLFSFHDYAVTFDLNNITAWYYAVLVLIGTKIGLDQPGIESGRRTQDEQDALLDRYNAGDPGIITRPADNSTHIPGKAFDLNGVSRDDLRTYGLIWTRYMSGTWGGNFTRSDPIHFDTRLI